MLSLILFTLKGYPNGTNIYFYFKQDLIRIKEAARLQLLQSSRACKESEDRNKRRSSFLTHQKS